MELNRFLSAWEIIVNIYCGLGNEQGNNGDVEIGGDNVRNGDK